MQHATSPLTWLKSLPLSKSPKVVAFPVDAIVIKSISLRAVGLVPPACIPLIGFYAAPILLTAVTKSPKSAEFPSDAIVIYSIEFTRVGAEGENPPAVIPLVVD